MSVPTTQPIPSELVEIAQEMAVQDNCHTYHPVWIVMEDIKVERGRHNADKKERIDPDALNPDDLCEKCTKDFESGECLTDDCDDCDSDSFWYFDIERQPALMPGTFLTSKACQQHIDSNSYHYKNPKPYAIPTWRNPEMDILRDFLLSLSSVVLDKPLNKDES